MDLFEWDPSDRISDRINELYPPDCPPPDGFVEMLDAHYNVNPGPGTWWAIGDKVWRSRKGKEQRSSDTSDTSDRDTDHDRDDNDEEENSSKEDGSDEESMDEDARMLGAAFDLLQRGLQAEDPFISSRHALKATPECFTRVDSAIEFYPHQKSGAGKIDHILHSGQVHPRSALLAWSMGLGKSMVMQAVMHNRRSSSTPTLLVLPLAVLAQWKADLDHSMDPPIDYIVYDKNVGMTTEEMKRHQLVVTTYQMVAADHARKIKTEAAMAASAYSGNVDRYHHHYPLHAMRWESVFADEVGGITNPDAAVTKAMIALQTDKRLGATGTPIPNDYKNLQALMAWLNIEPWTDEEMFNTYFVKKIAGAHKASPLTGLRNALLAVSLRPYLLRLDWEDTFDGLPVLPKLPKYKERIIPVTLTDPAEIQIQHRARRQWDEVYKTEQEQLEAKEDPDRPSDPCLQLDELLPYLNLCRMALVSPVLADPKYVSRPAKSNRKHHSAAKSLLHEELGIDDEEMMEHRLPKNEALAQIKSDTKHAWHSARMSAFTRDLKKRLETPGKVLVFDESRRVLIVVSNALTEMGIGHYMIHGDVRMSDRTEHLDAFKDPNTGHRVMLMTIRCGGLGLNGLTVANKCYFMTKTNSPFNEAQAMARAVRVGQENNVKVIKFYTHNSIERRTHVIQKEKITKAINTLDPNRVSERKLSQLRRWNTVERFKAKLCSLGLKAKLRTRLRKGDTGADSKLKSNLDSVSSAEDYESDTRYDRERYTPPRWTVRPDRLNTFEDDVSYASSDLDDQLNVPDEGNITPVQHGVSNDTMFDLTDAEMHEYPSIDADPGPNGARTQIRVAPKATRARVDFDTLVEDKEHIGSLHVSPTSPRYAGQEGGWDPMFPYPPRRSYPLPNQQRLPVSNVPRMPSYQGTPAPNMPFPTRNWNPTYSSQTNQLYPSLPHPNIDARQYMPGFAGQPMYGQLQTHAVPRFQSPYLRSNTAASPPGAVTGTDDISLPNPFSSYSHLNQGDTFRNFAAQEDQSDANFQFDIPGRNRARHDGRKRDGKKRGRDKQDLTGNDGSHGDMGTEGAGDP